MCAGASLPRRRSCVRREVLPALLTSSVPCDAAKAAVGVCRSTRATLTLDANRRLAAARELDCDAGAGFQRVHAGSSLRHPISWQPSVTREPAVAPPVVDIAATAATHRVSSGRPGPGWLCMDAKACNRLWSQGSVPSISSLAGGGALVPRAPGAQRVHNTAHPATGCTGTAAAAAAAGDATAPAAAGASGAAAANPQTTSPVQIAAPGQLGEA